VFVADRNKDDIDLLRSKWADTNLQPASGWDLSSRRQGEKSAYYPLGSYPEGCIVNEGAVKVKETHPGSILAYFDQLKEAFMNLFDFTGTGRAAASAGRAAASTASDGGR